MVTSDTWRQRSGSETGSVDLCSTYNSVGRVPKPLGVEVGLVHGSEDVEGVSSGISCSHVTDKYVQMYTWVML